jgi:uncharacterized protein (DUF1800 family)
MSAMPRTLSQLDPREAWKPAPAKTWDLKWAAHLFRRAAFGVPPRASLDDKTTAWDRLQAAVKRGQRDCIERLLAGPFFAAKRGGGKEFAELSDSTGELIANRKPGRFETNRPDRLQGWWLYRMLHTPHPLLERCTLFWHNHFATSLSKVTQYELMFRQNQLLRRHALGKFGPFLQDVSRDPAMLIWLDSNKNIKGKPNENYAREVMELFSLGVGNYTEHDIREAARAFTGWGTFNDKFEFNARLHDDGKKTVLGQTGNLNGDDVVRILLKQPAAARFLVRKLFREFLSEAERPSDKLLAPLVEQFHKSGYDIRGCLATMLRSNLFFSGLAYRARIKSPVEYVVGTLAAFDASVSMQQLAQAMEGMGQALFAPPNVKGWDGGKAWLNTATLLARHNFASKLLGGHNRQLRAELELEQPAARFAAKKGPAAQVDYLLQLLLQGDVAAAVKTRLAEFVTGKTKTGKLDQGKLRQAAHAILTTPEYQLA